MSSTGKSREPSFPRQIWSNDFLFFLFKFQVLPEVTLTAFNPTTAATQALLTAFSTHDRHPTNDSGNAPFSPVLTLMP